MAAGEPVGPVEGRFEQAPFDHSGSRDVGAEDAALDEVPGRVHPDGQPQAPGEQVAGPEQRRGREGDDEAAGQGRSGVGQVQQAEDDGDGSERPPAAQPGLDESLEESAEHRLLVESSDDPEYQADGDALRPADPGDAVGPRQGEDCEDGADERAAQRQPRGEFAQCAGAAHLGRFTATDSSDDEAVPRHDRDHARRRDEERGRQVGHGLRHDGCQQVRAAPRHDDDQGLGEEEEPRSGEPLEPGAPLARARSGGLRGNGGVRRSGGGRGNGERTRMLCHAAMTP